MGLERLELVVAIEDRFQTHLLARELEEITTLGGLYQLLLHHIHRDNCEYCPTLSMFYTIRRILVMQHQINRWDIHPSSSLNHLLPPAERVILWRTVKHNLAGQLPHLNRSNKLQWCGDTFPETLMTVGRLVRECCLRTSVANEFQQGNKLFVWTEVCRIVSEVAGVEPDTLQPNTNFAEDLGF